MNEILALKLKALPDSPGCYLMKREGHILYVGKAINLKNRVRSYFQSNQGHTAKVVALVEKVDDFDIMLCDTNLEALILEDTLIKRHMPYYNILLKDSKTFPYVRIDLNEPFPRLEVVRRIEKDGAKYFGPYLGATQLRETFEAVRKIFPLRTCRQPIREDSKPRRPCLHHQIGQCLAPCAGLTTSAHYHQVVREAIAFLNGKYQEILADLNVKMLAASKALKFEQAALLRDHIQDIERLMERQKTVSTVGGDEDILAVASDGLDAMVQVLFVRGGRLIGGEHYALERAGDEPAAQVLQSFILQYYQDAAMIPKALLTQELPDEAETLEALLGEKRGSKVRIHRPQRGQKNELVDMALKNAEDALEKRNQKLMKELTRTTGAMEALGEALGLAAPPRRIEGFDISNTQGSNSVASMVVCVDGVASKKDYRTFRIKSVEGPNDYASMHEAILRRFNHAKREREQREAEGKPLAEGSFTALPDLILVDGGPGQLGYARRAMHEAGFHIPMFGLAERLEEIFLPGVDQPLLLPRHSPALHLIQRIRDEAHRFAITRHRALRGKAAVHSQLEDIPGVGPARRKTLLKHFKNMDAVKHASLEALNQVPGLPENVAKVVYAHFLAQK